MLGMRFELISVVTAASGSMYKCDCLSGGET